MFRNRSFSAGVRLPQPSEMFAGIDTAARRICVVRAKISARGKRPLIGRAGARIRGLSAKQPDQ